jgi:hypothetical protein
VSSVTKDEFIDKFRHELGGMVMDAMTPRDGAHAAAFVRQILRKVDNKLIEMYGALAQPVAVKAPSANGNKTPQVGQTPSSGVGGSKSP